MKRTWKCPKCHSDRVGYLESMPDAARESASTSRKVGQVQTWQALGGRIQSYALAGEIEAFVCTSCGYIEEYVKNPGDVAWDRMMGFRWCRPEYAGSSGS